ncbi:MAG: permease-like cell division protein FtsX, partial [Lachnospiraceae bacterium]|nr:permease-like cell division protein FtsX [Lachnospiraceae bacterium]
MKGISVLLYSIKQGIKNLRHNSLFTLASVGTISACLFLFGIFYFIVSNFQFMVRNIETSVGVTVFFDENTDDGVIASIGEQIRARSEVSDVVFVSADEAWENFKGEVFTGREEEIAQTFGDDNPLKDSASYEVYLNDVSRQNELSEYI